MNTYIGLALALFLAVVLVKMIDLHQTNETLNRRLVMAQALIDTLNEKSQEEHKSAIRYKTALLSINNMLDRTKASADIKDLEQTTGVSLFMSAIDSCKRLSEYAVDNDHRTGEEGIDA